MDQDSHWGRSAVSFWLSSLKEGWGGGGSVLSGNKCDECEDEGVPIPGQAEKDQEAAKSRRLFN